MLNSEVRDCWSFPRDLTTLVKGAQPPRSCLFLFSQTYLFYYFIFDMVTLENT